MKFLVTGCSFAKGSGLKYENNDPLLWVNQLILSRYPDAEIVNKAEIGACNKTIFQQTCQELITTNYDFTLVSWSELSRMSYNLGLELYHTKTNLHSPYKDIKINPGITITKKEMSKVSKILMKYYNDHWSLVDLAMYTNVLIKLTNNRICFVNALVNIEENFFQKKAIMLPSDLSKFESDLLSIDTRNDQQIFDLYNKIHRDYEKYGGICEEYWLNLYNSLGLMRVDTVSEYDYHPGYKSQNVYFDNLHNQFYKRVNASKTIN